MKTKHKTTNKERKAKFEAACVLNYQNSINAGKIKRAVRKALKGQKKS